MASIIYAAFAFSDTLSYPGLYALTPTLGAALLILGLDAERAAPLRLLLSTLPMRWAGDRSYSLYLWHWPIIIFAREAGVLSGLHSILLIAPIVLVSHFVYSLWEYPIHKADIRSLTRRTVAGCAAGAIAVIAASSVLLARIQPTQSAERNKAIQVASADFDANYRDRCHAVLEQVDQPDCVYGRIGSPHKVVLFGDSHAAQWMGALQKAATETGWELRSWTKTSCPSADVTIWYPPKRATYDQCTQWRDLIMKRIADLNPSVVILVATAPSVYSGWLIDSGRILQGEETTAEFRRGMLATIDKLSADGRRIVVIRDNPIMYKGFTNCLAAGFDRCGRPRPEALGHSSIFMSYISSHRSSVDILDLSDRACNDDWCPAIRENEILYQDRHHFTATFATSLWRDFMPILQTIEER